MFVPTAHAALDNALSSSPIYQMRGPEAQMFVSCRNPFRAREMNVWGWHCYTQLEMAQLKIMEVDSLCFQGM